MPEVRYTPELRLTDRIAASLVATADPKLRAKVIQRVRRPLQEEIAQDHGPILGIAPTIHFLPFAPEKNKEKEVKDQLQKSVMWLKEEEGVHSAFVYELVDHMGAGDNPPRYLLVVMCEDGDVLRRLKQSDKGSKIQNDLIKLCRGKTARDEGEYGINSLLVGLV